MKEHGRLIVLKQVLNGFLAKSEMKNLNRLAWFSMKDFTKGDIEQEEAINDGNGFKVSPELAIQAMDIR